MLPFTTWPLEKVDSVLQAALLLRLSEHGRARDHYYELLDRIDADGSRLDAFSLGVFDALLRTHAAATDSPALLLYLLKLCENGPGAATVDAAARALSLAGRADLHRYIDLGRSTAIRALDGSPPSPGAYAELLMDELTSN